MSTDGPAYTEQEIAALKAERERLVIIAYAIQAERDRLRAALEQINRPFDTTMTGLETANLLRAIGRRALEGGGEMSDKLPVLKTRKADHDEIAALKAELERAAFIIGTYKAALENAADTLEANGFPSAGARRALAEIGTAGKVGA